MKPVTTPLHRARLAACLTGSLMLLALPSLSHAQSNTGAQTAASNNAQADAAMQAALADELRGEDGVRDKYRHPAETLAFFGVKPGMTVVDYMPSSGWYTRIIAPYLGQDGTYIGLNPAIPATATGFQANMLNTHTAFPARAETWLGNKGARVMGANVDTIPDSMNGTVDRFLIFREIHNMHRFDWLRSSLAAAHKLLKDDGQIGVVQHRAKPNASAEYTDGSMGYLREADVIALFQANGFDLVAKSEINANPADPANHALGVWMLPPGLSGASDETRPRLQAIGESDRMTLLFAKRK